MIRGAGFTFLLLLSNLNLCMSINIPKDVVVIGVLLAALVSYLAPWRALEPKSFEDCILVGMKGVSANQAADAITYACRKKFPASTRVEPPAKRSGNPRIDLWSSDAGKRLIHKVHVDSYSRRDAIGNRSPVEVTVTNTGAFPLDGVFIGVSLPHEDRSCPDTVDGYKGIHFCKGSAGSNLTGTFYCSDIPMPASMCLTGVLGSWESDLDDFFRRQGL